MKSTGTPGRAVNDAQDTVSFYQDLYLQSADTNRHPVNTSRTKLPKGPAAAATGRPLPNRAPQALPAVTCPSTVGTRARWGGHTQPPRPPPRGPRTEQCVYRALRGTSLLPKQPRNRSRRLHTRSHTLYKWRPPQGAQGCPQTPTPECSRRDADSSPAPRAAPAGRRGQDEVFVSS